MNNQFFGQKYFLDKKITVNKNQNYSQPYYKTKDEKESSDFVLQKMQLSLNNFLSNLKKTENIDNIDSYPIQPESTKTLDNESSFNFINSNFIQNKNIYNNFQNINPQAIEGFPRGKEKSETYLINKNNNSINNSINNINTIKYFRSPNIQEKNPKDFSSFSNSMNSFYSFHNNNLNNINKNVFNINNDYNFRLSQRANTENTENISSIMKLERNHNKILINENSSYSSEENKNINGNNNLNSNLNIEEINTVKKNDPIKIINNTEIDYKKLVEKIKEKKAEKAKENENNINTNDLNNNNKNNNIINNNN